MEYKNIRLKKETYEELEKLRWLRRDKSIDETVKYLIKYLKTGEKNK